MTTGFGEKPCKEMTMHGGDFLRLAGLALLFVLLVFIAFPHAFLAPAPLSAGLDDNITIQYPLRSVLAGWLRGDPLPLWSHSLACGYPLLAEPHSAFFYPPNWLLYRLLPHPRAYNLSLPLHMVLMALGSYLLARRLGISLPGSLLAALAFSLSTFNLNLLTNFVQLQVVAWIPWSFLALEAVLGGGDGRAMAGLALTTAMSWLAGFPQYAVYLALALMSYGLVRCYGRKDPTAALKAFLGLALGMGLAAVQLLPTLELVGQSTRAGALGLEEAAGSTYSLMPYALITLLFPRLGGAYTTHPVATLDTPFYVGMVTLALALLTLVRWRSEKMPDHAPAWALLATLALLFAIGRFSPLYWLASRLPLLNSLRVPSRALAFSALSLALLGGMGLDLVARQPRGAMRPFLALFVPAAIAVLGGGLVVTLFPQLIARAGYAYVDRFVYGRPPHPFPLEHYYARIDAFVAALRHHLSPANSAVWAPLLLGVATLLVLRLRPGRKATVAALALLLLDLLPLARISAARLVDEAQALAQGARTAAMLAREETAWRIYSFPAWEHLADLKPEPARHLAVGAALVYPNTSLLWGLDSSQSYLGLPLRRNRRLLDFLESFERPLSDEERGARLAGRTVLLGAMNVGYVLSPIPLESPHLEPIAGPPETPVHIYRNAHLLPRAFLVPRARVAADAEEALALVTSPDFRPAEYVVLEEEPSEKATGFVSPRAHLEIRSPTRMVVETAGGGWLLIGESFYPGWKALVDGHEQRLYRANYVFKALPLGEGRHRVELIYEPLTFRLGGAISLVTAMALTGLAWRMRNAHLR